MACPLLWAAMACPLLWAAIKKVKKEEESNHTTTAKHNVHICYAGWP